MNASVKSLSRALATFAAPLLLTAEPVLGQTFTTLHHFSPMFANNVGVFTNSDGADPAAGLLLVGNLLYGQSVLGGANGTGTVFAMGTNGAGFTSLRSFSFATMSAPTNSGGWHPYATLSLAGTNLFGTGQTGGTNANGTVFTLGTNGAGFKDLHSFAGSAAWGPKQTNADGIGPVYGPLVLASNVLYGTAAGGGTNGNGTLFSISTNGTGFKTLYTFSALAANAVGRATNGDGSTPNGGLVASGPTLYGVAFNGGTNGWGTLFAIGTNGAGFKTLHHFTPAVLNSSGILTNSEGTSPDGRLLLSGDTLYGTAFQGGRNGSGTVFAINTNGTGFTVLRHFSATVSNGSGYNTNSDGVNPIPGLILSSNTLYGTTYQGGVNGMGVVYAIHTTGAIFTNLHSFTTLISNTNSDGVRPFAGVMLYSNILYGTTSLGGLYGNGTVYSVAAPLLTLPDPPQLTVRRSGTNIFITWPTNLTGLTLQSSTNLGSSAVWTTATPPPGVVNTNNSFTNSVSLPRKFYRLN